MASPPTQTLPIVKSVEVDAGTMVIAGASLETKAPTAPRDRQRNQKRPVRDRSRPPTSAALVFGPCSLDVPRRMVPSVAPKSCRRIKPDACGEVASDQTTRHLRRAPLHDVVGAASDDFTGSGEPRIEQTCLLQYGVDRRRSAMFIPQKLPKNRKWEVVLSLSSCFHWRALRESNPCFRRERDK